MGEETTVWAHVMVPSARISLLLLSIERIRGKEAGRRMHGIGGSCVGCGY